MKIKDIMSKDMIICSSDTLVADIAQYMKEYDIGFIPISDDQEIIGVITDRDIIVRKASLDEEIEKFITPRIITIDCNDDIEEALSLMGKERVKRLIVKDDDKVVGIISLSDIINKCDAEDLIKTLKKIWKISRNTDKHYPKVDEFYL